jgi:hypothetical protein
MKKTALLLALFAVGSAHAECYSRSAAIKQLPVKIQRIVDVERSVVPLPRNQLRCVVTFRAQIKNQWHTGEAVNEGDRGLGEEQICAGAMDAGKAHLLDSVGGSKITMDQSMVCTDQPIPKVRAAVKIGDIIKESEVQIDPQHPEPFRYKNTTCRWFIETDAQGTQLYQWQGIACLVRNQEWQVVDKF